MGSMWVLNQKIGGVYTQNGWFISWKTLWKWMIWEFSPYFWKHPHGWVWDWQPPQKNLPWYLSTLNPPNKNSKFCFPIYQSVTESWFNNGQYTTVLGSILLSQRMQPGSCNSNVQGATFIQPTWKRKQVWFDKIWPQKPRVEFRFRHGQIMRIAIQKLDSQNLLLKCIDVSG